MADETNTPKFTPGKVTSARLTYRCDWGCGASFDQLPDGHFKCPVCDNPLTTIVTPDAATVE